MPPCGLRPIWPVASLLGRSSIAADTLPPSRLATGQIGRNERVRIYEIDHLETLKDDDQLVRAFAARAIWRTEQSADIALPVFLEALKSDQRYRRGRVVGFIGELGSAAETAVPALVEALRDEDNSIRAEAAHALGEIKS